MRNVQFKTANREIDPQRQDFHWLPESTIRHVDYPADAMVLERMENGDFYGFLQEVKTPSLDMPADGTASRASGGRVAGHQASARRVFGPIAAELSTLSDRLQRIDYARMKIDYRKGRAAEAGADRQHAGRDGRPASEASGRAASRSTSKSREIVAPAAERWKHRCAATSRC